MLALRYRPRRFADCSGQRPVVVVLGELVRRYVSGEYPALPAGLIFAGPRGSGKTSMARVVAAALNCEAALGEREQGREPCGVCPACMAVVEQTSAAVVELDGATAGLVDDVRQLRQLSRLAHSGRYRVFVLDECQALSPAAWSALLKQLEEPAPAVLYILVTTDLPQVPVTIVSRCLVFRFLPIDVAVMATRLAAVCAQEDWAVDPVVLAALADRAGGALRDALMLLEQLAITGNFSLSQVEALWPDRREVFASAFFAALEAGDPVAAAQAIRSVWQVHRELPELLDALARHLVRRIEAATASASGAVPLPAVRQWGAAMVSIWQTRLLLRSAPSTDAIPLDLLWHVLAQQRSAGSLPAASARQSVAVGAGASVDGRAGGGGLARLREAE